MEILVKYPKNIIDKSFEILIEDDLCLTVDYDDVNHTKTLALTEFIVEKLSRISLDGFEKIYIKYLIKQWNRDKWLRDDYNNDHISFLDDHLTKFISKYYGIIIDNRAYNILKIVDSIKHRPTLNIFKIPRYIAIQSTFIFDYKNKKILKIKDDANIDKYKQMLKKAKIIDEEDIYLNNL